MKVIDIDALKPSGDEFEFPDRVLLGGDCMRSR